MRPEPAAPLRVVVVTYSPGDALEAFLTSLASATTRPYDVVLADNGSRDGVPEQAARAWGVTLLSTGGNVGYGAAANLGASARTGAGDGPGPWLVVANPDVVWEPGSLDRLLDAGDSLPGAGCLGPAIRTTDGRLYPSARAFPSLWQGVGHALLGWWWPANPWTRAYRTEATAPVEGPTGWLSGACLLLRREAFLSVGGFDPSYFMYCEDMDLCRRLADAGWQQVHVPSAVVLHTGGHATRREPRRMLLAHHRSLHQYLSRQYAGPARAPLRAVLGLGLLLHYLLATRVRAVGEGAPPTRSAQVLQPTGTGSTGHGP